MINSALHTRIEMYLLKEHIVDEIKKDIKWIVSVLMLSLMWMGVADDFYSVIIKSEIAYILDVIYTLCDDNVLLNIPICLCLIYVWIKLIKNREEVESNHFFCMVLVVFSYLLLYFKSPFQYARIIGDFDYRMFLSIILGGAFLSEIWGLRKMSYYYKNVDKDLGFSPDYNKSIDNSESLKTYAETIVQKLLNTDLGDESFAVGITSEWGAGKTTFLHLLKDTISDSAYVIEFNPWICRNPEQVTNNFFSSLRDQLPHRHFFLSRSIMQYAKCLDTISISPSTFFSINLSNLATGGSLLERKKKLSEKISRLNKPIVVIIDDIDRLDRDEVFEVLRIIRNTADLSNIIYLVAFDKKYVSSVLSERNSFVNTSAYLEKIFQIEIQLPLVTGEMIWTTFENELKNQVPDIKEGFKISQNDQLLILKILNTYRQAKRFARLFTLSYSHLIKGSTAIVKLEWQDLFWLNLLQMYNHEIFDVLCHEPGTILTLENNLLYYERHPEEKTTNSSITHEILNHLWGRIKDYEPNSYSIRCVEHYEKYFTLQVQFSQTDFDELVNTEDVDTLIINWRRKGTSLSYIIMCLRDFDTVNLDDFHKKNFLRGLLSLSYYKYGASFYVEIRKITDFFSKEMSKETLLDWINDWLIDKLISNGDRRSLSNIVGALDCSSFSTDKIKGMIRLILKDYFDKEYSYSALDLLDDNSDFSYFLNNSFSGENRQFAFYYIVDTLSHVENKPTIDEYQKAYDKNTKSLLYSNNLWGFRKLSKEEHNLIKNRCFVSKSKNHENE